MDLSSVFDPSGLTPHGFCLLWQPGLIWLHAVSDGLIAIAYFTIPVALAILVRRRGDLAFGWVYLLFAAFILSCGVTHVMSIVTLWRPLYALEGLVKAVTAVASLAATFVIWRLIPLVLALPSPKALRDSEARLRRMFVKLPTALYSLDASGRLNEASETMAELLGLTRSQMSGRDIADFIPAAERARRRDALGETLRTGGVRDLESQFVTADGTVLDVLLSARVERGQTSAQDTVLTVVTDVTARRQVEAALRESEERLRQSQKMEAIGKLTGGIAHDFNNMLTVIGGNLDRLRERLGADPHGLHLLGQATLASQRADGLIGQLLAFSRKQRLDPLAIDARAAIVGMQALLSRLAGEQIELRIENGGLGWLCLADRNQLETCVVNLVINAAEAIGDRTMEAGSSEQGEIRIAVTDFVVGPGDDWRNGGGETVAPGEYVRVSVGDNGVGMSEEVRRRALEPFFTTKAVGKGSGLGLSQTYGFVCQSDGAMRIDSRPGRGTSVEILLPRTARAGSVSVGAASLGGRTATNGGETLLVVEDEPAVLEIATSCLRESGFEVISAIDGPSALTALADAPQVALVFTDIVMPGQSGVALAGEIWKMRPGMPVVFASGYSEETIGKQLPFGAKFIKKPYKVSAVTALIRASLIESGMVEA